MSFFINILPEESVLISDSYQVTFDPQTIEVQVVPQPQINLAVQADIVDVTVEVVSNRFDVQLVETVSIVTS